MFYRFAAYAISSGVLQRFIGAVGPNKGRWAVAQIRAYQFLSCRRMWNLFRIVLLYLDLGVVLPNAWQRNISGTSEQRRHPCK